MFFLKRCKSMYVVSENLQQKSLADLVFLIFNFFSRGGGGSDEAPDRH